jgi:PAS domain S-box-containing protein
MQANTADSLQQVGQRRYREQAALARFGQMAIVARDVASLLPSAKAVLREVLGSQFDADEVLDGSGVVRHGATPLRTLQPDELEFVDTVGHVLGLLGQQRGQDRSVLANVQGRFRRIFLSSPVALGISTVNEGRVLDVNDRWLAVLGYERDEVIGRTNAELQIWSDPAKRAELSRRFQATGVVRDFEMKVRTKSGAILDLMVSTVPMDADADHQVWLAAIVDITDRTRAETERDQMLAREQVARAEAEQALEKLRAVYAITDGVAASAPLGDLLGDVLRRLRRTLQIDHATVLLLDDDRKALYLRALEGPDENVPLPVVRVPMGAGVSGRVVMEGRAMIVNEYSEEYAAPIQIPNPQQLRQTASVMGAPFRIGDRVAGAVMVSTTQPRRFTEEELRLLVLAADRVGPAIERGRLIDRIRSGIERQRTLSRRLLTAQEEERRRLAVELHDELGQVLTAVKINLESLAQAKGAAGTFATMTATIQSVDDALVRVRDLALDLRPSVLDDLGLAAAIRWYVDRFARTGRIEVHLSIDVLPALEPELETACFRVAQEALTNVDRHSHARQVWIDLHVLDGALELSIRDDGVGFDVTAARARAISGASVGLLGMQERVSLVDGEYDVVQVPAGGTEVRARFPLAPGARS